MTKTVALLKPVFVYGTLKKDFYNHRFLEGKYDGMEEGQILGEMYNTGYFPAVVTGLNEVSGEIYYIKADEYIGVMKNLDGLEGYSEGRPAKDCMYIRKTINVRTNNMEIVECWVYIWNRGFKGLTPIEGHPRVFRKEDIGKDYRRG